MNCVSVFFNTDSKIEEKLCETMDNCMVFEDEYNEDLYNLCDSEEHFTAFEDQYDEELYNECAIVEENLM